MGTKFSIDRQAIADALIKSGDLHRVNCACGLSYQHDSEADFIEVAETIFESIAPFGTAGLRDLAIYANQLADEQDFRAAYEQSEKERRAEQADFSEFDQLALLIAVGRVDGDMTAYHRAADLVSAKRYTAREVSLLSTEMLAKLLI